jgi:hypothetical protein
MIDDAQVRVHPLVHVALERDHHFLRAEDMLVLDSGQLVSLVELAVLFRNGVHVMERVVAAGDFKGLADLNAKHVRRIPAALLVEDDGR